ncbi:MAG: sialate O-acetylesterase [Lentisphaeria bacterium]|nr:sialate O-acetylesterase [Lentisphaeria bacterium]
MKCNQLILACLIALGSVFSLAAEEKPIKVFILAGDENVLEQGQTAPDAHDKRGTGVPGTLVDVMAKDKRFAFLKNEQGEWVTRPDVVVYDAHRIHNETVAIGKPLQVGMRIGPELMLGHVLGDALDNPVLIIRYGTRSLFHTPGSRSLAHDYRSPSRASATAGGAGTWDVIHFNWGVWDTGIVDEKGKPDRENGKYRVPLEEYEKNMKILVVKLKRTGATLIFGTTTPLHEETPGRIKGDAVKYNEVAEKIMKENGVIINDLYSEAIRQGYPKRPDVHSVGDLGPVTLAAINDALKNRKTHCKPFPRVLIIGDSISSPYTRYVQKALDGKVTVYHNPGNGQHSRTGVENIDAWLDLKSYLLKGQEYLELIESVKAVLKDPARYYPDYKEEKLELSGFAWFQGIQDSSSEAKAKEYEKNLSGLITDVRKDLATPALPVVVAACYYGNAAEGSLQKVVHDAQMAVADPKQHPEFASTLTSIDTTPFFRDKEQSPGIIVGGQKRLLYYPQRYNNNAETFLLIGEAMGEAMLNLSGVKNTK